jgi:hypothetical protein
VANKQKNKKRKRKTPNAKFPEAEVGTTAVPRSSSFFSTLRKGPPKTPKSFSAAARPKSVPAQWKW